MGGHLSVTLEVTHAGIRRLRASSISSLCAYMRLFTAVIPLQAGW